MKFREIFRFELAYQLRRAWPWLIFAVLLVISFLMTRDNSLSEALHDEFFINSSFSIAKTTVAGSLIWLLLGAVVAGEAAARDVATRMHPLTYTAPISKREYLGGRFAAALVLNAFVLLAVQIGIMLAVYAPGVDVEVIGPFRPAAYLTSYVFLALPNVFFATAIQFWLASRSGRPMAAYLGSVLLFVMSYVVAMFMVLQGRTDLANLLDPVGVHFILSELSHLWTPYEKKWRLLGLEGTVLTNRLLWIGIGAGAAALTWMRFRFEHRTEGRSWRRGARAPAPVPAGIGAPISVPDVPRTFNFGLRVQQTLAIAWTSFRTIAKSWAGLGMLIGIPLLTVLVVIDQMETDGVALVPTTAQVVRELTGAVSSDPLAQEMSRWVIIPLLLIFFAGELVWREREAGVNELTDASPVPEWVPLLGKLLGLGLLLVVFTALLTGAGMLAQLMRDHHDFEPGLYLKILFGLQLPEYLLFAVLALAVHVLVNQKYLGHMVAVLAYVFIAAASLFGIEHNLLIYGAGPRWSYTEMRGFGASLAPWAWFKMYWTAWALLLAVIARLFWVRGSSVRRLQLARRRITRATAITGAIAAALIVAIGGFIFYNTNVLNEYLTADEVKGLRADYERRDGRYADLPQPRLTGTKLHVEIFPEQRRVEVRGTYTLVNRSAAAIDSIHLATARRVETSAVTFDRPAKVVVNDPGHRIYALARPLQPGEPLRLGFAVRVAPRGFRNSGVDASLAPQGTYFTNGDWLPEIGYQRSRELTHAADRRKYGLPPRPMIASLHDAEARKDRGAIDFEAIVGTREGQVAVAPGMLRRSWTERGRRYFHYATSAPIGNVYAFYSAKYAVQETRWNDVAIRIFHHPRHTGHLDRVKQSTRASLDYYSAQFGPYPYRHLTFVEIPGARGASMHADPAVISHGESFAYWKPDDSPRSLDLPYAVIAHEMGHQWSVPYANVEGAPVMAESLAWYYGLKVMEKSKGIEHLHRLMSWMRQPYRYPPIRRGEPLLRGLDPYMSYRRGPFALYALSEYLGEDRVNSALRSLLAKHRPQDAPLATTLDLYRELQAVTPDAHRALLHDFFEVNTFWQLAVTAVTAKPTAANTWQVTLDVTARKIVYDEAGVETEKPMDEPVEIGVFAPAAEDRDELSAPIYLQKHRIRSGAQTITVTVPGKPLFAGIDPYHLLDWEENSDDDNVGQCNFGVTSNESIATRTSS